MTENADLLRDVIDHPSLDGPRLIHADWLEDRGQPERAEFIRVQCELASYKRSVGAEHLPHAREEALRRRERELCPAYTWTWLPAEAHAGMPGSPAAVVNDWPEVQIVGGPRLTFRRGFVASVTLALDEWLRHGPAVVRAQPLEEVRLSDRRPYPIQGTRELFFFRDDNRAAPEWSRLPRVLYERLGRSIPPAFYDLAAAEAALSAACLGWAWAANPCPICRGAGCGSCAFGADARGPHACAPGCPWWRSGPGSVPVNAAGALSP